MNWTPARLVPQNKLTMVAIAGPTGQAVPMLRTLRFHGLQPGPRLLVTAGVHGDEPQPILAVHRLADLLKRTDFRGEATLCPVVNEAAVSRRCRVAEDGLDLARVCPGRAEGSVTERAAFAVSRLISEAQYYIDLHTGGQAYDVLPLAGYMLHPDRKILQWQRDMALSFGVPLVWGTDHRLQGRTLSVARDAGVAAIYVESDGKPVQETTACDLLINGCLNVMGRLGMMDDSKGPRGASRPRYFVEDPRPESGHLQRCHPATSGGIFEPNVVVGQQVDCGAPIGRLLHLPQGEWQTIQAAHGGLVVALAAVGRVRCGDGLAVVIDPASCQMNL